MFHRVRNAFLWCQGRLEVAGVQPGGAVIKVASWWHHPTWLSHRSASWWWQIITFIMNIGIGYVNNLLSTMLSTSCAYSSGFPRRLGLGTVLARKARTLIIWYGELWHSFEAQRWDTFSGNDCKSGVSKSPGAMQFTRIPWLARSLIGKVGSCFRKELHEAY